MKFLLDSTSFPGGVLRAQGSSEVTPFLPQTCGVDLSRPSLSPHLLPEQPRSLFFFFSVCCDVSSIEREPHVRYPRRLALVLRQWMRQWPP